MKTQMDSNTLGKWGEAAVASWLETQQYTILERRWHCRGGELDLIARTPEGILCFVEVKTRTNDRFVSARESVTLTKRRKLCRAAQQYLAQQKNEPICRFDVAEVYPGREGTSRICYWPAAFTSGDC